MPEAKPKRLLGSQFVKFNNEGDMFTGVLTNKRRQILNEKECGLYDFTADGNRCRMNGTDQIDDAMIDAEVGDTLRITFTGQARTLAGFDVRRFDIELIHRPSGQDEKEVFSNGR